MWCFYNTPHNKAYIPLLLSFAMSLEYLRKIGLSEGEIKVYEALLQIGKSSLNKIQEKTGIERRNIYDILNKLIEKGLASYITEKGVKNFQITHPNKILGYLEEQKKDLEEKEKEIAPEIPNLTKIFNEAKEEIHAEVFRGNEAIKALLEEALNYKENYWIGGNQGLENYESFKYWFPHFNKKRIKKKVFWYDLADFNLTLEEYKKTNSPKKDFYELRHLPKDLASPMVISIFGNKVAQIIWGKQSFAFVIESKEVKDSFMKYFKYFWDKAKNN
jgi:HTH-type transcriptional regulator, sugar sensing transcriptional regulator